MGQNLPDGESPSPPAPRRPPSKSRDAEVLKNLAPDRAELGKLALELYDKGFNVIPVGPWTEEDWNEGRRTRGGTGIG
jgi:hypothetical protein